MIRYGPMCINLNRPKYQTSLRLKPLQSIFILLAAIASISLHAANDRDSRLLVLGFDGMDPRLCQDLIAAGKMPNFEKLAGSGSFTPLATATPPQSPVAWSNVISGSHAGTHQIFDFIHRRPNPDIEGLPMEPFLSTSDIESPGHDKAIEFKQWRIPLASGKPVSLRRGPAFWDTLVAHGVKTTVYRIPANYPPPEVVGSGHFSCLCGMGTPDLLGGYGEFTCFTPYAPIIRPKIVPGGKFVYIYVNDHHTRATLIGPDNPVHGPDEHGRIPKLEIDFKVVRDPEADVVKIAIDDHVVLLNRSEWSDWLPLDFQTGFPGSAILEPLQAPVSVPAMVRFYVRSVHPDLVLYASPLNIDPLRPATPISTPDSFAVELATATGRFHTNGISEDARAARSGGFNEDEYLQQVDLVLQERIKQYRYALDEFDEGFLFYYFGTPDLLSHIFWRDRDPEHPGRNPDHGDRYASVIDDCYVEMDKLVGEALARLDDDDTLLILSDHGFTSFRRAVHLNTWLVDNGYLVLKKSSRRSEEPLFINVDWTQSRAYALGINGLFINQKGREKEGIVKAADATKLIDEISDKLRALRDTDESPAIADVYRVDQAFPGADPQLAPDLIIGYADNYRGSWSTALGGIADVVFEDNLDRWSGDHCVAPDLVPGILLSNRALKQSNPTLEDIAVTILNHYGIEPPAQMTGKSLW
jgi:predicted AlkP superfamily phosphohydrolase/phosphomutase